MKSKFVLAHLNYIIALAIIFLSLYCYIEITPLAKFEKNNWKYINDLIIDIGTLALISSVLTVLIGGILVLKEVKIGWVSFGLGFVGVVMGTHLSAHLFS